jgi:PTH2 family peptidyl-tRNA hydrolase
MTAGKAASQAGHAFLDAFLKAPPENTQAYLADGGTKVVLSVKDERELCDVYYKARMANLPCAMVIESEHVMPPSFDGSPIATAVGIGPVAKSEARPITKKLRLMQ